MRLLNPNARPVKGTHFLKVGQQVRLHPATDLFMMGVVYANVTSIGRKFIHFKHDRSGKKFKMTHVFALRNLLKMNGDSYDSNGDSYSD